MTTLTPQAEYRLESETPLQAWPLLMAIGLYPLWFLLGLSAFVWVAVAVPMLISLSQRRNLVVPKGFGFWMLFCLAAVGGVASLEHIPSSYFYFLRLGYVASATAFLVYLINGGTGLSTQRIIRMFTFLWMASIVGGYLAYFLGSYSYRSPTAFLLPGPVIQNEFIEVLVTPSFADVQDFLGFPVNRSKAPFPYTNSWGSMMGLLTPFALMALNDSGVRIPNKLIRLMLVLSLVPIITSLNRGLWLSLGIGILYANFKSGSESQKKMLLRLAIIGVVAAVVYYLTPLGELFQARLTTGHSNEGRGDLVSEAVTRGLERPFFGWGTPRKFVPGLPPIGTHGQVWNLIFVYGLVGLVGWVGAMGTFFWRTRKYVSRVGLWAHTVILVSLIQMFFYLQIPHQLFAVFGAVAVSIRTQMEVDTSKTDTEFLDAA